MVTTRRGADTQSPQVASAARASRKRLNDESATSTPLRNTKKRRSSSAEEQSSQEEVSRLDLRKDSTASDSAPDTSLSTPIRRSARGRPRKDANASQDATPETPVAKTDGQPQDGETPLATPNDGESVYGTPAGEDTPSVYATPATNLRAGLRNAACPCPSPASVTPKPRARGARSTPSRPSRLASSHTVDAEDEEATPKPESHGIQELEEKQPGNEETTDEAEETKVGQSQDEAAKAVQPKTENSKAEEPAAAPKRTHIRFGSEDPPVVPEPEPEPAKEEVPSSTNEGEEDSDDDAPEAVTASSAREQARAAEEGAAKVIERQENEAKRKRQEREARLREQAAAAKKRKQEQEAKDIPADVASSATIQAFDPSAIRKASRPSYDLNNLPALLPDDILAAAPDVRPATPDPDDEESSAASKKQLVNKHLKFLDEKAPKDVKKGPVKVRVLEKGNKFLPPKVSNSGTKSVRDTWLQGRKTKEGKKGSFGGLERRKIGGGFLRK
ncbi:U3 snoRNA associated [Macrophomina phaseolina MS6]|uniref:U3 snoRNA associated n=1 Tax=Macrophomina phaseolina (strain MS6) TaxID=1126212 RepID=K2S098_MACPH|nr:U3 snoRNA associated [Macrophomina phaseolina MS6]